MHIPIPISTNYIRVARGADLKFVSCAFCQERYAYLLQLEATGEYHDPLFFDGKGSAERAQAKAEQNLLQKCRNVVLPVPCPRCGSYQDDMARQLKEEASINRVQIIGLVIAVLSLVPLAFDIPYIWVLTIVLAVAGLALVTRGYMLALRFDPNAGDPEPRKALGQRLSVWGEQLTELLARYPSAGQRAPADRPPEDDPSSHHVEPA
jgi:hypothetical protein